MSGVPGDRTALVTGASRGIGAATALRLAARGYSVAVNYARSAGEADAVVSKIVGNRGSALAVQADVSKEGEVDSMFETVRSHLGPVTVLVNNVGMTRDALLLRMSKDDFDEVMATNLTSAFFCTKTALKDMLRSRWGRVISVASVAGITGNAGQANYAASKAALIAFTKSVAKEVGSRGITANTVAPGFVETVMTDDLGGSVRDAASHAITLGRFGKPDEVAAMIEFLASDESSYITGQVMSVDGGIAL